MTIETITDAAAPATAAISPILAEALSLLDRFRDHLLSRAADCHFATSLAAKYPQLVTGCCLQENTGAIVISCCPERIDDMAPILRELRARSGCAITPRLDPERHCIHYQDGGRWYVFATLTQHCTFKQVGTKTVEQPVYEISCK